jgi:hypothetical protein
MFHTENTIIEITTPNKAVSSLLSVTQAEKKTNVRDKEFFTRLPINKSPTRKCTIKNARIIGLI